MDFSELDGAARANLNSRGVLDYERYKARLLAEGTSAQDMDAILRGFIWDASEADSDLRSED